MRKYILIIALILLAIICFLIVGVGFKLGPLKIYSYLEVNSANSERKVLIKELNEKNGSEYEKTQTSLASAVKKYQTKKEEYDSLVEKGDLTTESNIYNSSLYDVDFLLTVIGNYATKNGVTLQFDIFKNTSSASISSEYIICNLNFTITGDYIPITNFIYNIENDDTLNFEISNFILEKGGENLQATFTVKNIPVNSKNLSAIPTTSSNITVNN